MANKKYIAGRRLEYAIKAYLESKGWLVTRASQSRGIYDLIGFKDSSILGIQAKRLISKRAKQRLNDDFRNKGLTGAKKLSSIVLTKDFKKELKENKVF